MAISSWVVAVLLSACAGQSGTSDGSVMSQLKTVSDSASRTARPYTTVAEAMPNVRYVVDGVRELRIADL